MLSEEAVRRQRRRRSSGQDGEERISSGDTRQRLLATDLPAHSRFAEASDSGLK
jgi:hypothetical protein